MGTNNSHLIEVEFKEGWYEDNNSMNELLSDLRELEIKKKIRESIYKVFQDCGLETILNELKPMEEKKVSRLIDSVINNLVNKITFVNGEGKE